MYKTISSIGKIILFLFPVIMYAEKRIPVYSSHGIVGYMGSNVPEGLNEDYLFTLDTLTVLSEKIIFESEVGIRNDPGYFMHEFFISGYDADYEDSFRLKFQSTVSGSWWWIDIAKKDSQLYIYQQVIIHPTSIYDVYISDDLGVESYLVTRMFRNLYHEPVEQRVVLKDLFRHVEPYDVKEYIIPRKEYNRCEGWMYLIDNGFQFPFGLPEYHEIWNDEE